MLSRTFKIQHSRVVWDDWTFQCHQVTIFTQTRSNWGHFRYKWRSNGGQTPFPWTSNNEGKWGVIFGVFEGAKLKSGLKNNEHHTGGHLCKKSGGQGDLHFDNFDVGCNIVKWGVIFGVIHASGLKSKFKKCVHHTGGHLGKKWRSKWPLFWQFWCKTQYSQIMYHFRSFSGC